MLALNLYATEQSNSARLSVWRYCFERACLGNERQLLGQWLVDVWIKVFMFHDISLRAEIGNQQAKIIRFS